MNELEDYARVRKEGSQPAGTDREAIDTAKVLSDQTGRAWRSDTVGRQRQMQEAIS